MWQIRSRDIGTVTSGIFAAYAAGGLFDSMFGLHALDTFGFGPSQASLLFAIEPACYLLLLTLLAPRIADGQSESGGVERRGGGGGGAVRKKGTRSSPAWSKPTVSACGLALIGLSLPLLPLGGSMRTTVASLLIHGAGYACKDAVGQ